MTISNDDSRDHRPQPSQCRRVRGGLGRHGRYSVRPRRPEQHGDRERMAAASYDTAIETARSLAAGGIRRTNSGDDRKPRRSSRTFARLHRALVACGLAHCATSAGRGFAGSEATVRPTTTAPAPADRRLGIDDTGRRTMHDRADARRRRRRRTTADVTPDTTPADARQKYRSEGTPDAAMTGTPTWKASVLADAGTGATLRG